MGDRGNGLAILQPRLKSHRKSLGPSQERGLQSLSRHQFARGKGDEAESKLFSILQEAWGNIREEVIDGLIASMPRRMAALIAAEGWHTKYQHLQIRVANRAYINRLSMQFWRFPTVVWGVGNRWNKCPVKGNFGFGGVCRRLLHI